MRKRQALGEKPLDWVGSSKQEFLAFPSPVQRDIGNALGLAQFGGKHPNAKPWKGEGPGVFEVVDDFDGDTYRAVYTVRFRRRLRAARVPEEIATRQPNRAHRYRTHCASAEGRAAGL
jgi:phage-related protein